MNIKIRSLKVESFNPITELTKVVIVGDHNQLPPVMPISPPKDLEVVLGSLFSYYVEGHKIPSNQLQINYRSHKDIVDFTSSLGFYHDLKAHSDNAGEVLGGNIENIDQKDRWIKAVLSKEKVVCSLEHDRKFDIGVSQLEAYLVARIIKGFYQMINPQDAKEEIQFWTNKVGVVAPHNAQGRTIIQKAFQIIEPVSKLEKNVLMSYLKNTVYSVEKFQGSDRDLIITSIGLSDVDKIDQEAEFIFDVLRFNVLTSRAKHKLIFISSKDFLNYVPMEKKVIENVAKFNFLVNKFCNKEIIIKFNGKEDTFLKFRYKQ